MSRAKRARRFPERIQEVVERLRKSNGLDAFQKQQFPVNQKTT